MAVGSTTGKIAVVADTPVQLAGTGAPIETHARTSSVKLVFVPDDPEADPPAVLQIGTEAAVTADEGFIVFVESGTVGTNDLELVADEEVWLVSTEPGEVRFRRA